MSRPFAILLMVLAQTLSAISQAPTAPNQDSTAIPKIVKQTRLVYVPVVVEGKNGDMISGLRKEQFKVEQDGQLQNIAIFEEVSQTVGFNDRAPSIAPGMVENFALSDAQARKTIVVILDTLNTPFLLQNTAKKALVKFIQTSLPPDQPVALMVLNSNGLNQVHSITADPKILQEVVNRVNSHYNRGEKTPDLTEIKEPLPNAQNSKAAEGSMSSDLEARSRQFEQYMDEIESGFMQRRAAEITIVALEQLAGSFAGIPGRKSVIWATGGFPFEPVDPRAFTGTDTSLVNSYYRAWSRLNDANIAIYPVDVNGLEYYEPPSLNPRFGSNSGFGSGIGGRSPNAPPFDLRAQQQSTLRSFASATGGKAFLNSNDIAGSFAKASQEAARYYLLGYYLRTGEDKPGWHKLKVHADVPHAEVRARDGFFLSEAKPKEKDRLMELRVALGSPADYTGVHFGIRLRSDGANETSSLKPVAASGGKRKESIHVSFPPGALEVDTQNGNTLGVEFVIVALVGDKTRGQQIGAFNLQLTPTDLEKVNRTGIGFDEVLEVPAGEYEVRAAIRDVKSGKLGTVRTHLVVP